MPEQVRCPECNAALRVPDNLLGKNVKCPKCQATFVAEQEEPELLERIVREPAPSGAGRRRPAPPDEEDEPPLEEEEEDRPRRRRRRRRSSEAASEAVAAPAIALMATGALGILMDIAYTILQIYNFSLMGKDLPPGQPTPPGYDLGLKVGKTLVFIIVPLALLWGITLLVGGLKMKNLQSFGLAMTSCILAMLPLNCCCFIGLPFGIWALVVLNKPEVKDAFS